jgi:hypothetical protein
LQELILNQDEKEEITEVKDFEALEELKTEIKKFKKNQKEEDLTNDPQNFMKPNIREV